MASQQIARVLRHEQSSDQDGSQMGHVRVLNGRELSEETTTSRHFGISAPDGRLLCARWDDFMVVKLADDVRETIKKAPC